MTKKFLVPIIIAILFCLAVFWGTKGQALPLSPDRFNEGYVCGFVMNVTTPPTKICFEDPSIMAGFNKGRDKAESIMPIRMVVPMKDRLLRAEQALEYLKSNLDIDVKLREMLTESLQNWVASQDKETDQRGQAGSVEQRKEDAANSVRHG